MLKQETPLDTAKESAHPVRSWALGLTSLLFVLLQSACSAVMAISGLRALIGIGSLAAASSVIEPLDAIHGGFLRVPMTVLASVGAVINLYVIWRIRSLRSRASSQWRMAPLDPGKRRSETIQLWLSVITLVLLAMEWTIHIVVFGKPAF